MQIASQKRPRGDMVRPAMSIQNTIWNEFKSTYKDKDVRDNVVSKLLQKQMEREVVIVNVVVI